MCCAVNIRVPPTKFLLTTGGADTPVSLRALVACFQPNSSAVRALLVDMLPSYVEKVKALFSPWPVQGLYAGLHATPGFPAFFWPGYVYILRIFVLMLMTLTPSGAVGPWHELGTGFGQEGGGGRCWYG